MKGILPSLQLISGNKEIIVSASGIHEKKIGGNLTFFRDN